LARAWTRLRPAERRRPGAEVFTAGLRRAWDLGYRWVNGHYANTVAGEIGLLKAPRVLIHDYHFHLLPSLLRERGFRGRMALFSHIPWPQPAAFLSPMPHSVARQLLAGSTASDSIGFHVPAYGESFVATAARALGERVRRRDQGQSLLPGNDARRPRCFAAPISVDPKLIEREVLSDTALHFLQQLRRHTGDRLLLVRAERIDPIKGLIEAIEALDALLT